MDIDQVRDAIKSGKLNLLEIAKAINSLEPRRRSVHGMTLIDFGRQLQIPAVKVTLYLSLLELPEPVQAAASEGLFTIGDLRLVNTMPQHLRNKTANRILEDKKNNKTPTKRDLRYKTTCPSKVQMEKMINYLTCRGLDGLHSEIVRWCMGRITDEQLYNSIQEYYHEDC